MNICIMSQDIILQCPSIPYGVTLNYFMACIRKKQNLLAEIVCLW